LPAFSAPSNQPNRLSDRDVTAVLPLPDGRVWLGLGSNGVDIVDPSNGNVAGLRPDSTRPETALPKDYVNAFAYSPSGDVYLGTEQGLYRADRSAKSVVRVCIPGRDPGAGIRTLLYDPDVRLCTNTLETQPLDHRNRCGAHVSQYARERYSRKSAVATPLLVKVYEHRDKPCPGCRLR
jgi:hypothetical protein